MREVARLPEKDRRDLFMATSSAMGVHQAIIEKDFWVCWILDYLFSGSSWKDELAFKGGTSLSKAYGAIERFSEDIDLILNWRLLGYADDEPWEVRTPTQQDKFGKEANRRTAKFLREKVAPDLSHDLSSRADTEVGVEASEQVVLITYPKAFSLESIRPQVVLEIGPLAEAVPNKPIDIGPYAAERFPNVFRQSATTVTTVLAERTFWEKATILHQEAHRGIGRSIPQRYSRHYYDLYRLSRLPVKSAALAKTDLLAEVVRFKMKFYRCPWAKYEEAKPGTLRLLPTEHHVAVLRRDYEDMQPMLFGVIPGFEDILAGLATLENEINRQAP